MQKESANMFDRLQAQIARTERRLAMLEKEQIFREPSHAISVKTSDQERNDQLHRSTIMQFTRHGPRYDTPLQRHINFEPFSARRAGYRVFQHRGRRCHTLIFLFLFFCLWARTPMSEKLDQVAVQRSQKFFPIIYSLNQDSSSQPPVSGHQPGPSLPDQT